MYKNYILMDECTTIEAPLIKQEGPVFIYQVSNKSVVGSYLIVQLPQLISKDKIRCRWLSEVGLYLIVSGKYGMETYDCMAWNLCNEFDLRYKRSSCQWSDTLPSYTMCIPQRWSYCNSENGSVICDPHKYKFNFELASLVQMQRFINDEWINIPFNNTYLEPHGEISVPRLIMTCLNEGYRAHSY